MKNIEFFKFCKNCIGVFYRGEKLTFFDWLEKFAIKHQKKNVSKMYNNFYELDIWCVAHRNDFSKAEKLHDAIYPIMMEFSMAPELWDHE